MAAEPTYGVGIVQVTGTLTAYFVLPRRKMKRLLSRERKFQQKLRKLAFKGRK